MTDHKITLVFVINGQEVPEETNLNAPLHSSVHRALEASGNSGRGVDQWEIRDANGVLLEPDRKVGQLNLSDRARLFVSLKVGAGGVCV